MLSSTASKPTVALDAEAFFSHDGWQRPENVWRMNDQPWQWSWYFAAGSAGMARMLAGITLVAAVMLALGIATPLAAIVSLVGLISAVNRAPLNVFGRPAGSAVVVRPERDVTGMLPGANRPGIAWRQFR